MHVATFASGGQTGELLKVCKQQGGLLVAASVLAVVDEHTRRRNASKVLLKRGPRPQARRLRVLDGPTNMVASAELDERERFSCSGEACRRVTPPRVRRRRHAPVGTWSSKMNEPHLALDDPASHEFEDFAVVQVVPWALAELDGAGGLQAELQAGAAEARAPGVELEHRTRPGLRPASRR